MKSITTPTEPPSLQEQIAVWQTVAQEQATVARLKYELEQDQTKLQEEKQARREIVHRLANRVARETHRSPKKAQPTTIIEMPEGGLDGGSSTCVVHEGKPHEKGAHHFQHHHHHHRHRRDHPICIQVHQQPDNTSIQHDLPLLLLRLDDAMDEDIELGSVPPMSTVGVHHSGKGDSAVMTTAASVDSARKPCCRIGKLALAFLLPAVGVALIVLAIWDMKR